MARRLLSPELRARKGPGRRCDASPYAAVRHQDGVKRLRAPGSVAVDGKPRPPDVGRSPADCFADCFGAAAATLLRVFRFVPNGPARSGYREDPGVGATAGTNSGAPAAGWPGRLRQLDAARWEAASIYRLTRTEAPQLSGAERKVSYPTKP